MSKVLYEEKTERLYTDNIRTLRKIITVCSISCVFYFPCAWKTVSTIVLIDINNQLLCSYIWHISKTQKQHSVPIAALFELIQWGFFFHQIEICPLKWNTSLPALTTGQTTAVNPAYKKHPWDLKNCYYYPSGCYMHVHSRTQNTFGGLKIVPYIRVYHIHHSLKTSLTLELFFRNMRCWNIFR